jgi:hypothetical protein
MKIPLYKYKFRQIFKKIGQTKALYLSYVFPWIFTVLTWTVKVKNKHMSVGYPIIPMVTILCYTCIPLLSCVHCTIFEYIMFFSQSFYDFSIGIWNCSDSVVF